MLLTSLGGAGTGCFLQEREVYHVLVHLAIALWEQWLFRMRLFFLACTPMAQAKML